MLKEKSEDSRMFIISTAYEKEPLECIKDSGAVASFLSYSDGIEEIKKRISLYRSKILFLCNGTNLDVTDLIEQEPIERVVVLNGISSYIGENGKTIQTWENFGTVESQSKDEMVEVSNKSIPALIAYTSGTTGDPKAIVFSNENLMSELIYLKNVEKLEGFVLLGIIL